ncbi:MAG TPA: FAD/NAD(P)-binding protein [Myxococcales bacterium]|nr:FAD/NAD(P)-binding protein [Myxococcales bacterium]
MVTFARMGPVDVAIVGGGASGTLVAVQLLQKASGPFRIALIERTGTLARGVAYGSPEPFHLLNLPAAGMSAFPDRPDDFVRWSGALPEAFVPRSVYGDYLAATLAEARARARPGISLIVLGGEATSLSTTDDGLSLAFSDGVELSARVVVLALGNLPYLDPIASKDPSYREAPWDAGALDGLSPDAPVLLLGTGLTMIDAALSLDSRGHRAPIHALSRHGLLPQAHGEVAAIPHLRIGASGLRGVLRTVRAAAGAANDWRPTVEGLRPITQRIWKRFSLADKRRFLRHVRPYWDVHRHRMAPVVAARIEQLVSEGRLLVHAGRLRSIERHGEVAIVRHQPRGERREREFTVARIVNCTGPAMYLADMRHPLIASTLEQGLARADALGLGFATDRDGALLGNAPARLFTLGNLRRGDLWETTAVPELRAQAHAIAERLVRDLSLTDSAEATV